MKKQSLKKRILSLFFVICMALTFSANAFAEGEWTCIQCGAENSGNFCGNCGSAREDQWICPDCQTANTRNFCENCGTAKPGGSGDSENSGLSKSGDFEYTTYVNNTAKFTIDYPIGCQYTETSEEAVLIVNDNNADFQVSAGYAIVTETGGSVIYSAKDFALQIAEDESLLKNWIGSQGTEITGKSIETISGQDVYRYDYELDSGSNFYQGSFYLFDGYGKFGCYYVLSAYNAYAGQAEDYKVWCEKSAESFTVTGKYENSQYTLYEISSVHMKFLLPSDFEGEVEEKDDGRLVIYPTDGVFVESSIWIHKEDDRGGYQETAKWQENFYCEYNKKYHQEAALTSSMTVFDYGRYSFYSASFSYKDDGESYSEIVVLVPYEDVYYRIDLESTDAYWTQAGSTLLYFMQSLCMDDYGEGDLTAGAGEAKTDSDGGSVGVRAVDVSLGGIVTFGSYEQDNDESDGKEPIEWIVLYIEEGQALLISRYILDASPYNTEYTNVTWETCTLRKWLNEEFLSTAFTEEEISKIQETTVTADKNPNYDTDPGNDTTDRIFLLSITEVKKYFADDESRKGVGTAYAVGKGLNVSVSDNNTLNGEGTSWWWLRSPGCRQDLAACVSNGGGVGEYGNGVNYEVGVRPAFWLNLAS